MRFYQTIADLNLILEALPTPEEIVTCEPVVGEKDAHVLAAALKSGADILLTLDRKHLLTKQARAAVAGLNIVTPGEFLRMLLEEQGNLPEAES